MQLSDFARTLEAESAFTVLGIAKELINAGKDIVELEIGDASIWYNRSGIYA